MAFASFASSSSASGPSRHWMLVWGNGSAGGQQMVSDFGLRLIGNRRLTISWPNPARQALTAAAGFPRLIPPNSFRINPVDCLSSINCRITLYKIFRCENVRILVDSPADRRIIVLPYMASLVAKKKGNQLYYYVVESARVDGQPRIVHQAYLGSGEKVAALVKDRTAPLPLEATALDFGLPGSLWLAAQRTGLFALLESLWPAPRSGPSPAHYLLLAAIHRVCQPGPKTEVADWYRNTILDSAWGFPPARFR